MWNRTVAAASPVLAGALAPLLHPNHRRRVCIIEVQLDVLQKQDRAPTIRVEEDIIVSDPTRAYFAAVAFAILDVLPAPDAQQADVTIYGVLNKTLSLRECPPELRPFMAKLCAIGEAARDMEEQDSVATVEALQRGEDAPMPRLDRARDILEGGVGHA
ncbi:hypothetical protein FOMPIDRAFT_1056099 [Fomitopsis schrenkii]|uniref:Uncharacterized protein n=1 Tax=Fomitopsis schrenkii TaxID=2126942 RepID=S8DQ52_FOMSC|nr:hypothetical protein FOMPIDRAFT_1056099 [Fomitopsis schrenkii]